MNRLFLFLLVLASSFIATFLGTDILIRKLIFLNEKKPEESRIFFGQDMAKPGIRLVPTMGGLAITFGFGFSLLLSLKFVESGSIINLLAGLVTILLITIIGFTDDILIVRKMWRIILPGIAALPLIVVDTGVPTLHLLNHEINLGYLYTYLLIPIGVIACANFINILAGFNGLEAGSGAIACATIFSASIILMKLEPGKYSVTTPIIALAMLGACLAFLVFNWYPAKTFPGNVGTYVIGAAIASAVIIGDMEKIGIIALAPQIIEFFLKIRGGFKAGNFGTLVNGTLTYKDRVTSLTHLFMKYAKVNEKTLVLYLLGLQTIFGFLAVWSIFWYR
ncbi:MAG: hypothetical protein HZC19_04085 [Candidatus Omnitrophica bacterium]|nr:hypothetical protein [Candidatus Omnitrophota bacterium]